MRNTIPRLVGCLILTGVMCGVCDAQRRSKGARSMPVVVGGTLTRAGAAKEIQSRVTSKPDLIWKEILVPPARSTTPDQVREDRFMLGLLYRLGYVYCVEYRMGAADFPHCVVRLTEKGQKVAAGENRVEGKKVTTLPTWKFGAKLDEKYRDLTKDDGALRYQELQRIELVAGVQTFIGVTGIAFDGNDAMVEVRWRYAPVNDIGQALVHVSNIVDQLDPSVRTTYVHYKKFDDGWRIFLP